MYNSRASVLAWGHCWAFKMLVQIVYAFLKECAGLRVKSSRRNLEGAIQHSEVVDEYLRNEIASNRVADPFNRAQVAGLHISWFGLFLSLTKEINGD